RANGGGTSTGPPRAVRFGGPAPCAVFTRPSPLRRERRRPSLRSPLPAVPHSAAFPVDPRHPDRFASRHLGPDADDPAALLEALGFQNPESSPRQALDSFTDAVVPDAIRFEGAL